MADAELKPKHRCVLLALMALDGEASNPKLYDFVGFTLTGAERRRLNELELVTSTWEGNHLTHELTETGWRWCAAELIGDKPPRTGSLGGALYAVLGLVQRYLDGTGLTLAEFCAQAMRSAQEDSSPDVETRIRIAYKELSKQPKQWVGLARLRAALPTVARGEIDETLHRMSRMPAVHFVPESNQKALTADDRAAAIRIGGQQNHLISIEDT